MKVIGSVLEASFEKGIVACLMRGEDPEDYPIGSLAIIDTDRNSYLAILNEVQYTGELNPSILMNIPSRFRDGIMPHVRKRYVNYIVKLIPIAKYSKEKNITEKPDTIPPYGARLIKAVPSEIAIYYGEPDWQKTYPLGRPKLIGEVGYEVPVDIKNLVNLNFGIYGKSGSGKTFIANLLVGYGILYTLYNRGEEDYIDIRFLIFDMHDEYSLEVLDNSRRPIAKGVANIFRKEFVIYTPDIENSNKFRMNYLPIPLYDMPSGYLKMIIEPLGVTQAFLDNLATFEKKIKRVMEKSGNTILSDPGYWILGLILSQETIDRVMSLMDRRETEFIESDRSVTRRSLYDLIEAIENVIGEEREALKSFKAGRRRLIRLLNMPISFKKKYSRTIDEIVKYLINPKGKSVVISMGRYEKTMSVYLALANLIGERLRIKLQEKIAEGMEESPTKIIILLEEAHKFLEKKPGAYSPFGVIAREMRKRGVIIVPIDQKPGDLDPDVTSMIWTNMVFALTDPKDVSAALTGIDNPKLYESIVYSLKPGEAVIYGPAVKFPVVLSIEDYSKVSREFEKRYKEYIGKKRSKSLYEDDLSRD
jgi:hypothetical protein